jgi:hypothetical protein
VRTPAHPDHPFLFSRVPYAPTRNHAARDASYPGSGNPHFFPEQLREGLEVKDVYDIWLGWTNEPNHREDITGVPPGEGGCPGEAR